MAKSKITVEFFLPTTSFSRISDAMLAVKAAIDEHHGQGFLTTMQGPIEDTGATNGQGSNIDRLGRREAGEPEGGKPEGKRGGERADAPAAADDGEPVKRGRGRPRKADSAPEARSPGGQRDERPARPRDPEGDGGDEPVRTRKGSDEGSGQGEGRSGGSERGERNQRGNREAPRLSDDEWGDDDDAPPAEEWGEEILDEENEEFHAKTPGLTAWPERFTPQKIDRTVVNTLLGEHYKATGGKDRNPTFDLMEDVCKVRSLGQVEPEDYKELAKALLKDIAKYKYGIKKAK